MGGISVFLIGESSPFSWQESQGTKKPDRNELQAMNFPLLKGLGHRPD